MSSWGEGSGGRWLFLGECGQGPSKEGLLRKPKERYSRQREPPAKPTGQVGLGRSRVHCHGPGCMAGVRGKGVWEMKLVSSEDRKEGDVGGRESWAW